jgi:hypothetical protein
VLSFLTAGLYLPFARTACRRWLVSHLEVGGVPLAFDGRVRTLLPSFLARFVYVWSCVGLVSAQIEDTQIRLLLAGLILLPGVFILFWVPPRFWLERLRLGERRFSVPSPSRFDRARVVAGNVLLALLAVPLAAGLLGLPLGGLRGEQVVVLAMVGLFFFIPLVVLLRLPLEEMSRVRFLRVPALQLDGVSVELAETPELRDRLAAEVGVFDGFRSLSTLHLALVALYISAPWSLHQDAASWWTSFSRAFFALILFVELPRNRGAWEWVLHHDAWSRLRYPGWRVQIDLPAERCVQALRFDARNWLLTAGLSTPFSTVKRVRVLAESLTFEPVEATPDRDAGETVSASV